VTASIIVGGFVNPVPVHVLVPTSARVGDKLPCTAAVDVSVHWQGVATIKGSVTVLTTAITGCASTRYWKHCGGKQPTVPANEDIVWHTGPTVLPPPERAGHIAGPDGTVMCVWCGAEHASVDVYAAACAHDCQVV
jgi:hypothetical protein